MKKVLTVGICGVGLVVGAVVLWKWVIPFIWIVLKQIFSVLAGLF